MKSYCPGIKNNLQHFVNAGIGAVWLSPIFQSPMVDFGYDISDYRQIDPTYGTMQDFEDLIAKAHDLGNTIYILTILIITKHKK